MLKEAELAPLEELIKKFKTRNLRNSKLVRVIEKMMELNARKRFTSEQLKSYI